MCKPCKHCGALKWACEKLSCCGNGLYVIPNFPDPPAFMKQWLCKTDAISSFFRRNIRSINTSFAMASLGIAKQRVQFKDHLPLIKVHGIIHHFIGHLLPFTGKNAFAQVYMLDADEQVETRVNDVILYNKTKMTVKQKTIAVNLSRKIVIQLQEWLNEHNYIVSQFNKVGSLLKVTDEKDQHVPNLRLHLRHDIVPCGKDKRLYNAPTADEVAIVMPDCDTPFAKRDIILQPIKDKKLIRIYDTEFSFKHVIL